MPLDGSNIPDPPSKKAQPSLAELKKLLESPKEEDKVSSMQSVITGMLNGEPMDGILMHVIRYCCTSNHHVLKKLLMIYWEIVEKRGPDGKMLPEMFLVCNALRNDLNHPNEYIRGSTLRLCTKMREREVLEPLVPSIVANLEHRHSYVRRNAVLAIFAIFKMFESLIPNAPATVAEYLKDESDLTARRNAFIMLFHCDQERAIAYMKTVLYVVPSLGDGFQLVVLELIRKLCRTHPEEKSRYIKCIITLMETASDTVLFECANTLVSVSNAPTAIRAAAACFTQLLRSQSDNNVKLVVLERLSDLKEKHLAVLQEVVMDVMRGLHSPNTDIQKKTVELGLDLVTSRTVEEMILTLKREVMKTSASADKHTEQRQLLVQAIHSCAVRFPDHAGSVVNVLLDFVGDSSPASALDVAVFAREIVQTFPNLRANVIEKLVNFFDEIKSADVYRAVLWILGLYAETSEEIESVMTAVKEAIGPLPLVPVEKDGGEKEESEEPPVTKPAQRSGPAMNADGTYAMQSAATIQASAGGSGTASQPPLREHITAGSHFLCAAIANCLTKLVLRFMALGASQTDIHRFNAECMLVIVSILRYGTSAKAAVQMDKDTQARIACCLRVINKPSPELSSIFLSQSRLAFDSFLKEFKDSKKSREDTKQTADATTQPDAVINFRQLRRAGQFMSQLDIEDDEFTEMRKAVGANGGENDFTERLNRMVQLTGFSDPIYAEAFVTVHQYDIVLDILVVNKTNETIQNMLLELSTIGDLKLCERPQTYALAPGDSKQIKASIKVSSTETGVIFGSIVYETSSSSNADKNCVILNEIHIDIMDYIHPATCSDKEFRKMWDMFEWENKCAVNTSIGDVGQFLDHVLSITNMTCLTPKPVLGHHCAFLSANLYAKSSFGEDALLNVSVEKLADGKLSGYIRIRSKTQGIALGLGDRVTIKQKSSSV